MKIVVTGASGLVGQALQSYVNSCSNVSDVSDVSDHIDDADKWVFLSSKDGDLTDRITVLDLFKMHQPDYIIHLAAKVGGLFYNVQQGSRMFTDNVRINENILEACQTYNVTKGIFCLSSCMFPEKPNRFPMDEGMIHESSPHPTNEGYAYSKRMLEMQCRWYNKTHGTDYVCLIPVNLYGEHDNFNLESAHVIPSLIHKFYLAQRSGQDYVTVAGTGNVFRQFVYASDLARLIMVIMKYNRSNQLIPGSARIESIICSHDEILIKDLAQCISHIMGFTGYIKYDTAKPDGCLRKTVSNQKLTKLFPDFKFTSMQDGLTWTIQWFKQHYPNCRI